MEWIFWAIVIIVSPLFGYLVLRVLCTAVFRSFFEQKKEYMKEDEDGRESTKKTNP